MKQALELCRKWSALKKQGGLGADTRIPVDNSIATLLSLGMLYHDWHKPVDAVQVY